MIHQVQVLLRDNKIMNLFGFLLTAIWFGCPGHGGKGKRKQETAKRNLNYAVNRLNKIRQRKVDRVTANHSLSSTGTLWSALIKVFAALVSKHRNAQPRIG
jgi:hypothetical protein